MRTLWNLKAYETELPPLGLSEDNLEDNFIMVHQSSKTKLLEWAQGVSVIYQTVHGFSEAHWTGSDSEEPVQTFDRRAEPTLLYFHPIRRMQKEAVPSDLHSARSTRAWLMATFGPMYLKHKNTGLVSSESEPVQWPSLNP